MTLGGHPFARSFRLVAWTLMATCSFSALEPYIAWAQPAPPPAPQPLPAPSPPPAPGGLPPGPEMTLDQAAPVVTPTPAPQGQGPIQRIAVEGTQRIEPDSVLSYLLLRQGQAYDPAIADRSLKVLFDTGLLSDLRMVWDRMTLTVRVVVSPIR